MPSGSHRHVRRGRGRPAPCADRTRITYQRFFVICLVGGGDGCCHSGPRLCAVPLFLSEPPCQILQGEPSPRGVTSNQEGENKSRTGRNTIADTVDEVTRAMCHSDRELFADPPSPGGDGGRVRSLDKRNSKGERNAAGRKKVFGKRGLSSVIVEGSEAAKLPDVTSWYCF